MRTLIVDVLALIGGFFVGIVLPELVGIIGFLLFDLTLARRSRTHRGRSCPTQMLVFLETQLPLLSASRKFTGYERMFAAFFGTFCGASVRVGGVLASYLRRGGKPWRSRTRSNRSRSGR